MLELKRGDEVELEVGAAAFSAKGESSSEGKSVARLNDFVIFVEGGVPGDVVKARIFKVKKSFAEARVVEVIKPSEFRTTPRCQHFGVCGGCKWQHVDYQLQLKFKQQHVVDAFERIGGFSSFNTLPIIGASETYFYRNKMEFSFSHQQWLMNPPERTSDGELPRSNDAVFLGLHVPQRYDKVLDIEECHLQSETSNRILSFVRVFARRNGLEVYSSDRNAGYLRFLVVRQSVRTGELMVNLVTFDERPIVMEQFAGELVEEVPGVTTVVNTVNSRKAQIAYGEKERVYFGDGLMHEVLGGYRFTISASSFFQTNTAQAEKLYAVAKAFAQLGPEDVVFDLYSGTGSIALFVSDVPERVVGIESVQSAIRDAERNARENRVTNCSFVLGDLKDRLTVDRDWMSSHPRPTVMIIDPPRSGMHPKVVEEVGALAPSRIVYVSCNPTTQARDVKLLCERGYTLGELQPVDMFPHTYHIENVALLIRRV
jgi:23S rRNA (uracil1939-C5)-methyltransferase